MRSPAPLPIPLASAAGFTIADAAALEIGRPRLRRSDLVQVFHGVHAVSAPATFQQRAAAYLPLHVSAVYPAQAPRTGGVVGHRLTARPGLLDEWAGYPVTGGFETWCSMATSLPLPNLVAMGDHLVRHGVQDPMAVLDGLQEAMRQVRRAGIDRLEQAFELIRPGARSAMESIVRVLIVLDGLPEPEVNVSLLRRDGAFLGEGDMVYRRQRQLVEYEGDDHRTDRKQFRKDITRREDFEDEGWGVIRVTADDVFIHRQQMLRRIARRLGLLALIDQKGPLRTDRSGPF